MEKQGEWPAQIPVSERMPEAEQSVLIYVAEYGWVAGILECDVPYPVFNTGFAVLPTWRVTHWMPRPPTPTAGNP